MKLVATALLVAMALVYALTRAFGGHGLGIGFVRAFAEAAMVGGLADWFAVTALFRHPLGLPIPHTAIIPNNKDRIGDALAGFLRRNFLIPAVIARRMRRVDIAGRVGVFLATPASGDPRLRSGAARLVGDILQALDQDRLGGLVKGGVENRLRAMDLSPLLADALDAAIAEDRHLPLLEGLLSWANRVLTANHDLLHDMISDRAGAVMRWTGLDETLANAILSGLSRLLDEVATDPDHPMRAKIEEGLHDLAQKLRDDPVMRARVAAVRDELLDNPAMRRWLDSLWELVRARMLNAARNPQAALAGQLGDVVRNLGTTLQSDVRLRALCNRFARRALIGIVARYGDNIVALVSETIRSWDAVTVTNRIERAVGRDLQFIRLNGTLVGGLVGVGIHAVDVWGKL